MIVSQMFTRQILQSSILLFALWALFLVNCKEIDFSLALTFCSRNKMLDDNLQRMDCHLDKDTVLWIALSVSLTPLISVSLTKLISESLTDSLWKSTTKLSLSWLSSGLIPTVLIPSVLMTTATTAAAAGSCISCCRAWLGSGLITTVLITSVLMSTSAATGSCISCCDSCRATLCIKVCVAWSS